MSILIWLSKSSCDLFHLYSILSFVIFLIMRLIHTNLTAGAAMLSKEANQRTEEERRLLTSWYSKIRWYRSLQCVNCPVSVLSHSPTSSSAITTAQYNDGQYDNREKRQRLN